jgi:hypothetical protein
MRRLVIADSSDVSYIEQDPDFMPTAVDGRQIGSHVDDIINKFTRRARMKELTVLIFVTLFFAAPAVPCWADETKDHVCFRAMDTDKDGWVTFTEFEKFYGSDQQRFNEADADRDGKLTHDEYHQLLGHGSS